MLITHETKVWIAVIIANEQYDIRWTFVTRRASAYQHQADAQHEELAQTFESDATCLGHREKPFLTDTVLNQIAYLNSGLGRQGAVTTRA